MTSNMIDRTTTCDPSWTASQADMCASVAAALEGATVVPDGDVLRVTVTVTMRPEEFEAFRDVASWLYLD